MSGIYIHIPFCRTRCNYCDFYSSASLSSRADLVKSIANELELRKDYLPQESIQTIYFGGGTPSLLNSEEFGLIFDSIYRNYTVASDAEITFEANPDDLSKDYLDSLAALPFNRLSIGIQSFDDEQLKSVNRRHSGKEALAAIKNVQEAGFNNVSIDLIYGLPSQSFSSWQQQVEIALQQNIQHISAYGLTYEEGTVLWFLRQKGKVKTVQDDSMVAMYRYLIAACKEKEYELYEISNFALPGYHSRHNSAYWQQKAYLGVGPSAHSYDGSSRQWNIASSKKYIQAMSADLPFWEKEELSLFDRYNDFVLVSLRTRAGLHIDELERRFGVELKNYFLRNFNKFIDSGDAVSSNGSIYLTVEGFLISDMILAELMKV